MSDQTAGWFPDPSGDPTRLRYWNGQQWTEDYAAAYPPDNRANVYGAPSYAPQPMAPSYYPPAANDTDHTLRLIAFIFCVLSTLSVGWLIVPLLWMVPMTVHCWGIYQGTKPNTGVFGVCTLIFLSVVGGILLLVSKKDL